MAHKNLYEIFVFFVFFVVKTFYGLHKDWKFHSHLVYQLGTLFI
jgi:hypothetical protein